MSPFSPCLALYNYLNFTLISNPHKVKIPANPNCLSTSGSGSPPVSPTQKWPSTSRPPCGDSATTTTSTTPRATPSSPRCRRRSSGARCGRRICSRGSRVGSTSPPGFVRRASHSMQPRENTRCCARPSQPRSGQDRPRRGAA